LRRLKRASSPRLPGKLCALQRVRPARRPAPLASLVNDRLDVAIASAQTAVHLATGACRLKKQTLIPPPFAFPKASKPRGFPHGRVCHSLESAQPLNVRADYIFSSAPSSRRHQKASFGLRRHRTSPGGLPHGIHSRAGHRRHYAGKPGSCCDCGCAGIAAIRLFQDRSIPIGTINDYVNSSRGPTAADNLGSNAWFSAVIRYS